MKDKSIRVIAVRKQYKSGKLFMIPPIVDYENGGKVFTGVELATKEEVEEMKAEITDYNGYIKSTMPIRDGQTLNLSNSYDYAIYLRCLICSEICNPGLSVNPQHLFYLHDEELIADKEYEHTSKAFKAMTYLADKTEAELRDIAIYCGIDIRNTKVKIWSTAIQKKAMDEPEIILKFKDAPNKDNLIFAHKTIQYGLINRNRDGYFYKGSYLGATIEAVINELAKEGNKHIISKLSFAVNAVENPGGESLKHLLDDNIDENHNKDIDEKNAVIEIQKLQIEYMKLTGKEYSGKMVISELQKAVEVETKVSTFVEKAKDMNEGKLRQSLALRGVPKETYDKVNTKEELIGIGIEHIRING